MTCGQQRVFLTTLLMLVPRWTIALDGVKPNYRPEFEAMDLHKGLLSREYYDVHYARIGQTAASVNRVHVFNANFTLKKDLPKNAWFTCTAFELKANNAYSLIPVKLVVGKLCDVLMKDQFVYKDICNYSNLPTECPFVKNSYNIRDYVLNQDKIPPQLPGERWRVDCSIQTSMLGKTIIKWSIFFFLNRNL